MPFALPHRLLRATQGTITLDDGVVVPCGEIREEYGIKSELVYNEFIVYDVSQIKTRFLLRVKFNYKTDFRRNR